MLKAVRKAVAFGKGLKHVFIGTADVRGLPHIASGGELSLDSDERLHLAGWCCPTTSKNLEDNRLVSLVFWDPQTDFGYQVLGEVEQILEKASLNGYAVDEPADLPQVEQELVIWVKEVCVFSHAPHTDRLVTE